MVKLFYGKFIYGSEVQMITRKYLFGRQPHFNERPQRKLLSYWRRTYKQWGKEMLEFLKNIKMQNLAAKLSLVPGSWLGSASVRCWKKK